MNADITRPDLDLLAADLLEAADPFLPAGAVASILGVEFRCRPTVALLVPVDGGAPRVVARHTAGREHADLVDAAERLVTCWLNTLPEDRRVSVGFAIDQAGACLRVYANRDSHELALAVGDGDRIVELASRRFLESAETVQ